MSLDVPPNFQAGSAPLIKAVRERKIVISLDIREKVETSKQILEKPKQRLSEFLLKFLRRCLEYRNQVAY